MLASLSNISLAVYSMVTYAVLIKVGMMTLLGIVLWILILELEGENNV